MCTETGMCIHEAHVSMHFCLPTPHSLFYKLARSERSAVYSKYHHQLFVNLTTRCRLSHHIRDFKGFNITRKFWLIFFLFYFFFFFSQLKPTDSLLCSFCSYLFFLSSFFFKLRVCHFFSSYFKCFLLWQTRKFFYFDFIFRLREKKELIFFWFFLYTSLFFFWWGAFKNIKSFLFFFAFLHF